ncbi:MAG: hypothetical protein Q4P32_10910 [Micrococcales bacterium]|nr:hypothetical protein [Micrococcales bacterium]
MCQKATCSRCGKATWKGCGRHIDQALAGVPSGQRCRCTNSADSAEPKQGGMLARLFGR